MKKYAPVDKLLQCLSCKNWLGKNSKGIICKAFPDGIPEKLQWNTVLHDKPMYGQKNDIVFEPIETDEDED